VRAAIFNICASYIEGASFLDLCAGSGAVGFEALSHNAAQVTFVDSHPAARRAIKENAATLGVEDKVSITHFEKIKNPFDIIFLDPPYETELVKKFTREICEKSLLMEGGWLIVESPLQPPKEKTLELIKTKEYGNTFLYVFTFKKK